MGEVEKLRVQKTDAPAAAGLPVCLKTASKQLRPNEANHRALRQNLDWTLCLEAQLQHLILQAQKTQGSLNQMDDIATVGLCSIHIINSWHTEKTPAEFSIALNLVSIIAYVKE
ncbi:hypothetical protein MJO28_010540 [Puccinia striiformis f. sp. tritici]|uniref:Uncharacterized protein n=1 Tax=Puccinia striiformis f. sp. tritici TaxID=168172 RepID=A0ACC0E6Z0_9BASI|nr:hypothetical protein MJO28_010540 [Puccinia striiformis f. sp. tritici]